MVGTVKSGKLGYRILSQRIAGYLLEIRTFLCCFKMFSGLLISEFALRTAVKLRVMAKKFLKD